MKILVIQYWFRQPILWGLTWSRWSDIQTIFVQINTEDAYYQDINSNYAWRLDLDLKIHGLLQEKIKSQGIKFGQVLVNSITQIQ